MVAIIIAILSLLAAVYFVVSSVLLVWRGEENVVKQHFSYLLTYVGLLFLAGMLLPDKVGTYVFYAAGVLAFIHFLALFIITFPYELFDPENDLPARLREMDINEREIAKALSESEDENGNWIFGDDWKEDIEEGELP